jgi:Putative pectate lyase-like adhesive domain
MRRSGVRERFAVLVVTSLVVSLGWVATAARPAAAAIKVRDEKSFRDAWGHQHATGILLDADITLRACKFGGAIRNSATALTVTGRGHTIRQTCPGQGVLVQTGTGSVTFDAVTITGGDNNVPSDPLLGSGGGIRDTNGPVTLKDSTVTGNSSSGSGGGVAAIGDVSLTNSTVGGNTAAVGGGGIFSAHSVTVTNSIVTGNASLAGQGGIGGFGGGIDASNASVAVTNSTVANNRGGSAGGVRAASVSLTASTVYDNAATSVFFGGAGGVSAGSVSLLNSTVTANSGTGLGGGGVNAGSLTLSYSTVVENSGLANVEANSLTSFASVVALPAGGRPNCGAFTTTTTMSSGFNFSDDASCGFTGSGDTQNGGNPALGPLLNNGGPTLTRMPFFGSPLIGVIPPRGGWPLCGVATDQRGVNRPQLSFCDVGAVEAPPPA